MKPPMTTEDRGVRIAGRLKKLEATAPACEPGLIRFVRGEQLAPDAGWCPKCGTHHILVVHEIVVETRADVERASP
ncbi:hypothetical protein VT84_12285 [Gemmata sp. SH-PL17]|nr:hypothetical protein VT84_12285 [Gemmata sp. SH-PL17]